MQKKIIILMGFLLFSIAPVTGCGENDRLEKSGEHRKPKEEYTRDKPGEWEEIAGEHLPVVTIHENEIQNIRVRVNLKSAGTGHYIEKIGIMDSSKRDIAVKTFSRHERYFEAKFSLSPLPEEKGTKVYVKCNLHDLWTVPISEAKRIK
jgi:desulfoferrodoxin (superoxide reductase-like protein)